MAILFDCPGCGQRLQVSEVYRGRRTKCPTCAAISTVPGAPEPAATAIREGLAGGASRAGPAGGDDTIAIAEEGPTCPGCRSVLPPGGVLCVNCGHDLRTGKRHATAHEPFEQRWDAGLPLALRIGLAAGLVCLCVPAGTLTGEAVSACLIIFAGSVFLVLLLGTFLRLHVVRTSRGKVLLTRTWCIAFIPAVRHQVNVRKYDALLIDARGQDAAPVLIVFLAILAGVLGVLLWWLLVGVGCQAYLRKDRGREDFVLYRGRDEGQMREIVETLRELTGLRVERR